jgi:hypothetical protein
VALLAVVWFHSAWMVPRTSFIRVLYVGKQWADLLACRIKTEGNKHGYSKNMEAFSMNLLKNIFSLWLCIYFTLIVKATECNTYGILSVYIRKCLYCGIRIRGGSILVEFVNTPYPRIYILNEYRHSIVNISVLGILTPRTHRNSTIQENWPPWI